MALVHRRFCVRRRLEISIFAISSLFLGQLLFISFRLETLHPTIFESTKLSALLSFQYRENNGTEKAVTQTETNKRTAQKADNNNSKAKHTTFATKKKGVRLDVKVSGNKNLVFKRNIGKSLSMLAIIFNIIADSVPKEQT